MAAHVPPATVSAQDRERYERERAERERLDRFEQLGIPPPSSSAHPLTPGGGGPAVYDRLGIMTSAPSGIDRLSLHPSASAAASLERLSAAAGKELTKDDWQNNIIAE